MAGLQENIPQWFEKGVFNFFKLTPEVIEKFTIDPNASERVRREDRRKLGEEWMHGTCKFCKFTSKIQYKNPSNWVRHLLVSLTLCLPYVTIIHMFSNFL
jgi:hypothetical protein